MRRTSRLVFQSYAVLALTLGEACGSSCEAQDDLAKAFGLSMEEDDAGSLRLLQVARFASSTDAPAAKEAPQTLQEKETVTAVSWMQELMKSTSGTYAPLLILSLLALGMGVLILLLLQWLDSRKEPAMRRRGLLHSFCNGERACGTSKKMRSIPEEYAQLFQEHAFSSTKSGKWSYPGMGTSFTPGPKAATAELLVSKCPSTPSDG
ncbi:unnamed protein product [Effrenium voratum]|nr:unnamed protein product [Effrenium voratum]|mmetsp:Transcript_71107/g.169734  ORF Transcript_71107/g.169734 Transcript_71107/m.169734 type:complete len:207 (-) Transcript_71107:95-715(-)